MAAAEGPTGDGEPWQSWLPNHVVFLRLREGLKTHGPAEAEKPASSPSPSSPPPLTRNLVLGLGGDLFLWDGDGSAFLVVRLRGLGGAGDEPSLSQYQVGPHRGPAAEGAGVPSTGAPQVCDAGVSARPLGRPVRAEVASCPLASVLLMATLAASPGFRSFVRGLPPPARSRGAAVLGGPGGGEGPWESQQCGYLEGKQVSGDRP